MKKTILLVLPISILCLFGCKGKDSKMPTIYNQDFRNVNLVDQDGNKSQFVMAHFNDSPVGYFSLGKYVDIILKERNLPFTTKYSGHKYIMHNNITNTDCTIDFDQQTITYDNYDKFSVVEETYTPIDILLRSGKKYFKIDEKKTKYEEKGNKRIVDMSSYNIPLYFDQSFGYVPIDIIGTIVIPFLPMILSYNGTNVYVGNLNGKDEQKRKEYFTEGNIFTKDYMEYTYNLLALELDFNFGLDKRQSRTKTGTIEYSKGNAYEIIKPYHDDLVSLTPGVSDEAYFKLFANKYDDGGHTIYADHNCLAYENTRTPIYGDEYKHTCKVDDLLSEERAKKQLNPAYIIEKESGIKNNGSLHCFEIDETNEIAFLTFDKFIEADGSIKESDLNKENYWKNTMSTVTWANKQLREHSNIKKLVVDLSLNIGGSTLAEHFIASWLCDGVTTKIRNTIDKTYQEITVKADVNMDGSFDDKDILPNNIEKVYCMVSAASFSCGNLLPHHLKELRDENNTKIMGECSGGGSCLVYNYIPTGLGVHYSISSSYQLGNNKSSSYDNFESNEAGATSTFYEIKDYTEDNVIKFYDRKSIISAIADDK